MTGAELDGSARRAESHGSTGIVQPAGPGGASSSIRVSVTTAALPKPEYVKFNVDSLIRADTKTRYEVHQIARTIGLNNVDEIRAIEDMDPLPDGQGQDYSPIKAAPTTTAPPKEIP